MTRIHLLLFVLLTLTRTQGFAAPFQDLDFEQVDLTKLTPDPAAPEDLVGPTPSLLPGWRLFQGSTELTTVGFDRNSVAFAESGGASIVSLQYQPGDVPIFGNMPVISGNYSLAIHRQGANFNPFTLVRRGDIPSDARLLYYTFRVGPWQASIDGISLNPSSQIGSALPATVMLDVSAFAGRNVELKFQTADTLPFPTAVPNYLDDIGFVVPEPSTLALSIAGVAAFGLYFIVTSCKRRRKAI